MNRSAKASFKPSSDMLKPESVTSCSSTSTALKFCSQFTASRCPLDGGSDRLLPHRKWSVRRWLAPGTLTARKSAVPSRSAKQVQRWAIVYGKAYDLGLRPPPLQRSPLSRAIPDRREDQRRYAGLERADPL